MVWWSLSFSNYPANHSLSQHSFCSPRMLQRSPPSSSVVSPDPSIHSLWVNICGGPGERILDPHWLMTASKDQGSRACHCQLLRLPLVRLAQPLLHYSLLHLLFQPGLVLHPHHIPSLVGAPGILRLQPPAQLGSHLSAHNASSFSNASHTNHGMLSRTQL